MLQNGWPFLFTWLKIVTTSSILYLVTPNILILKADIFKLPLLASVAVTISLVSDTISGVSPDVMVEILDDAGELVDSIPMTVVASVVAVNKSVEFCVDVVDVIDDAWSCVDGVGNEVCVVIAVELKLDILTVPNGEVTSSFESITNKI